MSDKKKCNRKSSSCSSYNNLKDENVHKNSHSKENCHHITIVVYYFVVERIRLSTYFFIFIYKWHSLFRNICRKKTSSGI